MSREHFHESQIEDRIADLMEKGMSDEDAIRQAESEYDGQVNLVEDKALKIHQEDKEDEQALRIHEKAFEMNKEDIQRKVKQGCYRDEIILDKVIEYLKANSNSDSEHHAVKEESKRLLGWIDHWIEEVNING